MHPLIIARKDRSEDVETVRLRNAAGNGVSDTFHLLDKNSRILCGAYQGVIDVEDETVVEDESIDYGEALDREDVCRRCTGQAYETRNGT